MGRCDGRTFTPQSTATKWADYGPDDYAGVTYANTGNRRIFMGWMSNWEYANQVPTAPWRNATTAPRELALRQVGTQLYLASEPTKEIEQLFGAPTRLAEVAVKREVDLTPKLRRVGDKFELKLSTRQLAGFALVLSNSKGEEVAIGYDKSANRYFIDRTKSGPMGFSPKFAGRHTAPRLATGPAADLTLLVDATSVEVFADHGLTVMSELFFPSAPFAQLKLTATAPFTVQELTYAALAPKAP